MAKEAGGAHEIMYRSVRGNLPTHLLSSKRAVGPVVATEHGFMSVSRNRAASVFYMQEDGDNVLWQLHTSGHTAEGLHLGADLRLLSIFPEEEEVLFPPNSALQANRPDEATWEEEEGRRFLQLDAVPSFI